MPSSAEALSIKGLKPGDLGDWLALRNQAFPWPVDRERFLFYESLRPSDEPVLQLGAWIGGELVATAEAYVGEEGERYVDRAESFIMVAPSHRRQGIGSRLAQEIEGFAGGLRLRWLEAILYARDLPLADQLLTRRGFRELERYRDSIQEPAAVDLDGLQAEREALRRDGIETLAFSTIDIPNARQALYACAMAIEHDMPHEPQVEWRDPPFETWERKLFDAPGASSDAIFVARDGNRIVGLTYLVRRANGDAEVGDTGVIASHRRRGIARVLKMMATAYAAEHGIPRVQTDNRSDNAAMLAINTELGFKPREDIVIFEKAL